MAGVRQLWFIICFLSLLNNSEQRSYDYPMIPGLRKDPFEGPALAEQAEARMANEATNADDRECLYNAVNTCEGNRECCRTATGPQRKSRSVSISYSCGNYYGTRYYTKCGLFNWLRCPRYRYDYRSKVCYGYSSQSYYSWKSCPPNEKVCCRGLFYRNNCCMSISRILECFEQIQRRTTTLPTTRTMQPTTTASATSTLTASSTAANPTTTTADEVAINSAPIDNDTGEETAVTEHQNGSNTEVIDSDTNPEL